MAKQNEKSSTEDAVLGDVALERGAPAVKGEVLYIRAIKYSVVGRVTHCNNKWVFLEDAAYVASDGRFAPFTGGDIPQNAEVEPLKNEGGRMRINADHIGDITPVDFKLPMKAQ